MQVNWELECKCLVEQQHNLNRVLCDQHRQLDAAFSEIAAMEAYIRDLEEDNAQFSLEGRRLSDDCRELRLEQEEAQERLTGAADRIDWLEETVNDQRIEIARLEERCRELFQKLKQYEETTE